MICVSNDEFDDELRDITIGNHYDVRGVISDPGVQIRRDNIIDNILK